MLSFWPQAGRNVGKGHRSGSLQWPTAQATTVFKRIFLGSIEASQGCRCARRRCAERCRRRYSLFCRRDCDNRGIIKARKSLLLYDTRRCHTADVDCQATAIIQSARTAGCGRRIAQRGAPEMKLCLRHATLAERSERGGQATTPDVALTRRSAASRPSESASPHRDPDRQTAGVYISIALTNRLEALGTAEFGRVVSDSRRKGSSGLKREFCKNAFQLPELGSSWSDPFWPAPGPLRSPSAVAGCTSRGSRRQTAPAASPLTLVNR